MKPIPTDRSRGSCIQTRSLIKERPVVPADGSLTLAGDGECWERLNSCSNTANSRK